MYLRPLQPRTPRKKPISFGEAFGGKIRFRLLGLIIALFLVIKLIDVVREPKAWHWFFRLSGIPVEEVVSTDIPNPKLPTKLEDPLPEGVFVAQAQKPIIAREAGPLSAGTEAPDLADPLPRVWKEAWRDIYDQLEFHERGTVYRALKAGRDEQPLEDAYQPQLAAILPRIDRAWTAYQAEATAALVTIPDEEKPLWLDLLRRAGSRWSEQLLPALEKLSEGRLLSNDDRVQILAFQDLLDANLLREVQDDTVWRASETEISFRLFERVQGRTREEKKASAPDVSYLQLFKQSPEYRGEWVRIRGVARQAWHVRAQKNWIGIDGYYVFVVKPYDINSPIIVYSLELPPGFPEVKDKDIDKSTTELNDPMEFTGLYLKRWAYVGQDGTYTAPLVIAKTGIWTAPEKPFGGFGVASVEKIPQIIGWIVTTLVLLGVVIWYFRPRPAPVVSLPDQLDKKLENLEPIPVTDQLKQLQEEESASNPPTV